MSRYVRKIGPRTWLICGLAVWLITLVTVRAHSSPSGVNAAPVVEKTAAAPDSPQTPPQAGGWSVSDCATCHDKAVGAPFERTTHAKQDQSCAKCHSGVAEHAKAMMSGQTGVATPAMKTRSANDINKTCLTCHEKNNQANYETSMHTRRNVACTDCHSVHSAKSPKALLKTMQDTETCYTCHPAMRAKMQRTSHHPVREGKMTCASCHNPHDGSRPKLLKADTINELCYKCHTEKRGPFLFEHAPVREDCASCHDPHGTNQERMLVAKQPYLCQRCHYSAHGQNINMDNNNTLKGVPVAAPPVAGVNQTTRSSRAMERSCKQCHITIHGTNHASGRAFVR